MEGSFCHYRNRVSTPDEDTPAPEKGKEPLITTAGWYGSCISPDGHDRGFFQV